MPIAHDKISRRSQSRDPRLRLVAPLERILQAPGDLLSAWEPLLDDEDPWVRALARVQLGKMRIMLGQAARGNIQIDAVENDLVPERLP